MKERLLDELLWHAGALLQLDCGQQRIQLQTVAVSVSAGSNGGTAAVQLSLQGHIPGGLWFPISALLRKVIKAQSQAG